MKVVRSAAALVLALLLVLGMQTEALAASKAKYASSVASYDESDPGSLRADHLYAQSAILIDATSGTILFEKNTDLLMYPASTTKLMTALLVMEHCSFDEIATCAKSAQSEPTWIDAQVGEEFTVEQLMYALLLKSANDAANILAEHVSGSIKEFAALMNQKALELGCENTNFNNANGLPDSKHYTTVADMVKIARAAYQNDTIREIMKTQSYVIPSTEKYEKRTIKNSNKFLADSGEKESYPYGVGMKTGFTNDAQSCFVGAAEKDGLHLISVVFGSSTEGKWTDSVKLMDYGFQALDYVDVNTLFTQKSYTIAVRDGMESDTKNGLIDLTIAPADLEKMQRYYDTGENIAAIKAAPGDYITLKEPAETPVAPIAEGQVLAQLVFQTDGMTEPITIDLVAKSAVAVKPAPTAMPQVTIDSAAEGTSLFPDPQPTTTRTLLGYLMLIPAAVIALIALLLLTASIKQARAQKRREAAGRGLPPRRPPNSSYTRYHRRT